MPNAPVALVTWFSLLNVGGAILAAVPVAFGLVLGTKVRGLAVSLAIGLVSAVYIVVGGFVEYGVPTSVEAWIVDITQFIAVSLAVAAIVALIRGYPLTIGSSNRGKLSPLDQGVDR